MLWIISNEMGSLDWTALPIKGGFKFSVGLNQVAADDDYLNIFFSIVRTGTDGCWLVLGRVFTNDNSGHLPAICVYIYSVMTRTRTAGHRGWPSLEHSCCLRYVKQCDEIILTVRQQNTSATFFQHLLPEWMKMQSNILKNSIQSATISIVFQVNAGFLHSRCRHGLMYE